MSAAARPQVSVFGVDGKPTKQVALPDVFLAPVRPDLVRSTHTNMAKNKRQPYAVNRRAGMQHAAESWGTGRAVARIPRVSGGGTNRSGQGAFGNMCRKGRMFAPTKTWRRWNRQTNLTQRRFAVCSALAASAIPALVMARGHRVDNVPEVPLVVSNEVEAFKKTASVVEFLKAVGAYADVEKVKQSKQVRSGKGKMRNRRYTQRRGPLVVYANDDGVVRAFRNLPGVEVACVDRLNLLQLAPGGHVGRFCIWTEAAFAKLDEVFGTQTTESKQKKGFRVPAPQVAMADLARIINSDEVQSKVRPTIKQNKHQAQKKNPLRNLGVMIKLNPYAKTMRRQELLAAANKDKRVKAAAAKRTGAEASQQKRQFMAFAKGE